MWTTTSVGTATPGMTLPSGTVQVAIGIEPLAVLTGFRAKLTVEHENVSTNKIAIAYDTAALPALSGGTRKDAYELHGTLIVGANTLRCDRVFTDGAISVDCDAGDMLINGRNLADTGPQVVNIAGNGITPDNDTQWLPLDRGANAVTRSFALDGNPGSGVTVGLTVNYYERFRAS